MNSLLWQPALLIVMFALAVGAGAAPVPDLYAASVPVADDSEQTPDEAREEAYTRALADVLVRVSGQRDIARNPAAEPILEQAGRFVQQYTYRPGSVLWAAFDGSALEQALATAGLPVWNRDRPAILIWLAVDLGGGQRRLIGAADEGGVKSQIERLAAERGLPLVWPLLDSTDLAAARVADVWGGFGDKVRAASERYAADAVLVARLRRGAGRLYGSWDFESGAGRERWQAGVNDGVHGVADFLVARLASVAGDASAVVSVTGINGVGAYSNTLHYLERLSLVESVSVLEVRDDLVLFQVSVRGDAGRLHRAIEVGHVLAATAGDGASLAFRYAQ